VGWRLGWLSFWGALLYVGFLLLTSMVVAPTGILCHQ
jgi:hypothetical protein